MSPTSIVPAILCGGSGSRLWPLSRLDRPKQLLRLGGDETLLDQTLRRCAPFGPPMLVGAEGHVFPMVEAMRDQGLEVQVLTEPSGRNTAAAAVAVALEVAQRCSESLVLLVPADHRVGDVQAYQDAVSRGERLARQGRIVVFGVKPDHPSTRFGYIRPETSEPDGSPVAEFVEKPAAELAEEFLERGYLWNAGMFLFAPRVMLEAFAEHAPEILESVRAARAEGAVDEGVRRFGPSWDRVPAEALDRAVMEKTEHASVVPVSMGWTDVGTYDALHAISEGPDGNAIVGDVVPHGSTGNYLHADGVLLAVQDIQDLVVVATPDATLVAPRSSASDLKRLVSRLGSRKELREHRSSTRPWGEYEVLEAGQGFQVKRLVVAPGESLSLQRHAQRDEHWIVARGRGVVQLEGEDHAVQTNDHVRIGVGVAHRVSNPHQVPLVLIEVQVGDYLGEDDIERLEDRYGRT